MAATIRPSLILNMDIDERQFSDDVVAEIKRSYSYVAPSVVAARPAPEDAPVESVIRLVVRMHRPYWDANDEAAREQWDAIMPKWLGNMFTKVSSTVLGCNNVRERAGAEPLPYAWMELELGDNLTVAQATNPDSSFPACALEVVERLRAMAAAGELEGAVRVSVPSRESFEAQRAAALEAAAEEEPAESGDAAPGAPREDDAAPALTAAEEAEGAMEAPTEPEGEAAPDNAAPALPFAPAFTVDCAEWGIEYADGTVRRFDSATGEFVA